MFACMQTSATRPRTKLRAVATGRERATRRVTGVKLVHYRLHVSKEPELPPLAVLLANLIARAGYPTPTAFARAAGVNPSSASRWLTGEVVPGISTLEKIAPYLKTTKATLVGVAYPGAGYVPDALPDRPAPHPLAVDVERLLADDSQVPDDERATLATLIEHIIKPYRRYLRKRRSA